MVAYLGEEGALAVGELDFGDIEKLELPLRSGQPGHSRVCIIESLPESLPFCHRPIVASSCRAGRSSLDDAGATHGARTGARLSASEAVNANCGPLWLRQRDEPRALPFYSCLRCLSFFLPPPPTSTLSHRELLPLAPSAHFLHHLHDTTSLVWDCKQARASSRNSSPKEPPRHAHQRVSQRPRHLPSSPEISSLPSRRVLCPTTARFFRCSCTPALSTHAKQLLLTPPCLPESSTSLSMRSSRLAALLTDAAVAPAVVPDALLPLLLPSAALQSRRVSLSSPRMFPPPQQQLLAANPRS